MNKLKILESFQEEESYKLGPGGNNRWTRMAKKKKKKGDYQLITYSVMEEQRWSEYVKMPPSLGLCGYLW